MARSSSEVPPKLRPFIALGFEYHADNHAGDEYYGDCLFCGGRKKLYINAATGQWDCKAGSCGLNGNTYTFLAEWYKMYHLPITTPIPEWLAELAASRHLPPQVLQQTGVVHDGVHWYIPIYNGHGKIVNFRRCGEDFKLESIWGLELSIWNLSALLDLEKSCEPVYICEGEWDAIALRHLLETANEVGCVIGVPGAGVWKERWSEYVSGRTVICCYDHDLGGVKGTDRLSGKLAGHATQFLHLKWPESLPNKFDVRDFVVAGGTYEELQSLVTTYVSEADINEQAEQAAHIESLPPPDSTDRPTFEEVLAVFRQHLKMSDDMVTGLKLIFAVVLSNQIGGDPLWMHIVSPPGTAKTELLMPLSGCPSCYFASTLTAHSLVSGFATRGGGDPSLLPKLNKKTFVLKDFTEILNLPSTQRDEIYGTLRGAYDGSVTKHYGNGLVRNYEVQFNMISGVTHAVFGERTAALGERFLMFHLVKGVGHNPNADAAIRTAIGNVGHEIGMREGLHEIVQRFVEVKIDPYSLPTMPEWLITKIVALASLVGILRANVNRAWSGGQEKLQYRPQHEMGTRIGKQLTKLTYGLSLLSHVPKLDEDNYAIVSRVALDTCVGFNLEAVAAFCNDGDFFIEPLCEKLDIPLTTLRDQLEDLYLLGAVTKTRTENPFGRGAPRYLYGATDHVANLWEAAGLKKVTPPTKPSIRRVKVRRAE